MTHNALPHATRVSLDVALYGVRWSGTALDSLDFVQNPKTRDRSPFSAFRITDSIEQRNRSRISSFKIALNSSANAKSKAVPDHHTP